MTTISINQPTLNREEEKKSASVRYGLVEERYSLGDSTRISYGISAYADSDDDGTSTVVCSIHDITSDKARLQELVRKCNQSKLSAEHLRNVVEDFIAE